MKILFEQKKPGRVRQDIVPVEMDIEGKPATVGQLIESAVRSVVASFNRRAMSAPGEPDSDNARAFIGYECMADLVETGRVAFGIVYNGRQVDPDEAVANALQCYDDGLFRMFLNGAPLEGKDTVIDLNEGDILTVVRLTLLAGRLW
ncbi:MAG: hypothetical protein NC421_08395 [Lachnospiraceae bacterium]|nr:hypothetical protein [Lachnospiraceae bacterium]